MFEVCGIIGIVILGIIICSPIVGGMVKQTVIKLPLLAVMGWVTWAILR